MIKLIIFDLSGTCFTNEEPRYLDYFSKKYKIDRKDLDGFYMKRVLKSEINQRSGKSVWKDVLNKYKIREDTSSIIEEMMKLRKPVLGILNIAKNLRKRYKIVYLTNYNKDYWDVIKRNFNLKPYFDFGIVSYQIKSRKPSKYGFLAMMKHFKVKQHETVFIDDSEKNVKKAAELGIKAINFKNKQKLVKDLKRLDLF